VLGIVATLALGIWGRRRQERTGQPPRTL